jgi:hypothetical protein
LSTLNSAPSLVVLMLALFSSCDGHHWLSETLGWKICRQRW